MRYSSNFRSLCVFLTTTGHLIRFKNFKFETFSSMEQADLHNSSAFKNGMFWITPRREMKTIKVTITKSDMKSLIALAKKATKLAEKYAKAQGIEIPVEAPNVVR